MHFQTFPIDANVKSSFFGDITIRLFVTLL